jgi:glycosyltransferase involved in cell wall biosynthesis
MRILFLSLSGPLAASSRTRVFQHLPHLARAGVGAKVIRYESGVDYWLHAHLHPITPPGRAAFIATLGVIRALHLVWSLVAVGRLLLLAPHHDVVFVQKVLLPRPLQRRLRRVSRRLVFDFDDAIQNRSPSDRQRLDHLLRLADLVVLENETNEDYVRPRGPEVIRQTGPIDCDRYQPGPERDGEREVIIGWVGSVTTTPYLEPLREPLARLSARHPEVVLELIGAGPIDLPGVRLRRYRWTLASETRIMTRWDVGIMPLTDDPWARGKGGYKLLQYMALGLASICSPVGINQEIITPEVGCWAATSGQWHDRLDELVGNGELRRAMGRAARDRAVAVYSFERYTPELVAALTHLSRRDGRRTGVTP